MNSAKKTPSLPKELTKDIDHLFALHLVVGHLSEIPDFSRLWNKARETLDMFFEAILPAIRERIVDHLSSQARDALLASQGPLPTLCSERDRQEAARALGDMTAAFERASQVMERHGKTNAYSEEMAALVKPFGIPDLAFTLLTWDVHRWGLHSLLTTDSKIEGPFTDHLISMTMKSLTDLNAAELARETPAQIRKRIQQRFAPLSYHFQRSKLDQRIDLWIQNKVCGRTAVEISKDRHFGEEWVREQIREATRILGATVSTGRPRKGGYSGSGKQWAES